MGEKYMKAMHLISPANTGKTSTLILLKEILCNSGFKEKIIMHYNNSNDFAGVFENDTSKIGIISAGDTVADINIGWEHIRDENCDIIIFACRTRQNTIEGVKTITYSFESRIDVFKMRTVCDNSDNKEYFYMCNYQVCMHIIYLIEKELGIEICN